MTSVNLGVNQYSKTPITVAGMGGYFKGVQNDIHYGLSRQISGKL